MENGIRSMSDSSSSLYVFILMRIKMLTFLPQRYNKYCLFLVFAWDFYMHVEEKHTFRTRIQGL